LYSQFPLFQSHIDLAHRYWKELVLPGDTIIDATCGNGHDTLVLCKLDADAVYGIDLQQSAVNNTNQLLKQNLSPQQLSRVKILLHSHACFPAEIPENSVRLIVYNLGYLPGGNKNITTMVETTLASLEAARKLLLPGGAISITCYPGHEEGQKEKNAIIDYASKLSPQVWNCFEFSSLNRKQAPSLLLLQKTK